MDWDAHWLWLRPLTVWLGRYALLAALAAAGAGGVLWLGGARFSRGLVTLLAVSVGAVLGMNLPGWMGWQIDGMGLAVGAAMALGLTGYLLHNTWVGAALCGVLTLWAATGAWILAGGGTTPFEMDWSAVETALKTPDLEHGMVVLFQSLPGKLPLVMPCAVAGAVTAGVAVAVLSVRLARVLAYSLGGLTLLVVAGVWAMHLSRPQWLAALPREFSAQLATLAGLVVLGVMVQWRLTPGGNAKLAGAGGGANWERSEKE